jgi:hypothetical protein
MFAWAFGGSLGVFGETHVCKRDLLAVDSAFNRLVLSSNLRRPTPDFTQEFHQIHCLATGLKISLARPGVSVRSVALPCVAVLRN